MTHKLVRSNCTTAQVIAALTKYHNWTAKAPDASKWLGMAARFEYPHVVIEPTNKATAASVEPATGVDIPPRSDWSIYRPVKKRKAKIVARLDKSTDFRIYHDDVNGCRGLIAGGRRLDPTKTYRLLLVEVTE